MQLSSQLKRWGIKSRAVRIGESTLRGYLKSQFVDAWARYLPDPPSEVQQRNSDEQSTAYDLFQGATESRVLHPGFGDKSLNSKDCCGVAPCEGEGVSPFRQGPHPWAQDPDIHMHQRGPPPPDAALLGPTSIGTRHSSACQHQEH